MDQAQRPFSRHAGCRRWVHPTQYDWPVGQWLRASIPWPAVPPLPTPFLHWPAANRANAAGRRLDNSVQQLPPHPRGQKLDAPIPDPLPRITSARPATGQVKVKWVEVDRSGKPTKVNGTTPYGLVISARGFGDERCFLEWPNPPLTWNGHPFRSFEFWASDPFERPNLGVPLRAGDEPRPRVLISGGGDGAYAGLPPDHDPSQVSCGSLAEPDAESSPRQSGSRGYSRCRRPGMPRLGLGRQC